MAAFAGWDMPLEYSGIVQEHLAVRTRAGLFDVSHMGEIELSGPGALAAVQRIASNDASKLSPGQAQYSCLMTPRGTCVDDVVVYCVSRKRFLLVVNAANVAEDLAWIERRVPRERDVAVVNHSSSYSSRMATSRCSGEKASPMRHATPS